MAYYHITDVTINAVSIALRRLRNRTGDSLAQLHLGSTELTTGHNASGAICPEEQPGRCPGNTVGEKIMDECDSSLLL